MNSKSPSRRKERGLTLRNEILESARRLFAERGYENVTLRAIAEEIGYSHSTIYNHFPTKAAMMSEICREAFALLTMEIARLSESESEPRERLFQTTRGVVRFCLAHPQHFRLVFLGPDDRGGIRAGEFITIIGEPVFERLNEVFIECITSARIELINPLLAAHTWWTAMFGLIMAFIVQGHVPQVSPQEMMVEEWIRFTWGGMKAGTPST